MMKHGKKWQDTYKKVDRFKEYSLSEALEFLKQNSVVKFDETLEICVNLGVDPRKSDQAVRGAVPLPHGLGKKVRVLAFAQGEKAKEAENAGADYVGSEELAEKIKGSWFDFDAVIATPDMMKVVGKLGKLLGPRGMMPNPKVGTVTMDVEKTIHELKAGKAEFRVDKGGILHAPLGKLSFEVTQLAENARAFIEAVVKAKPSAAKGQYIKKVTLTSTMGQGLSVTPAELRI
ncbi:MAG: 50S ribosomal protein L1 [Chitinivibrionales bacterium]|nr:50S ribosomal protein L1 [Chitinivibrionales bacterium]